MLRTPRTPMSGRFLNDNQAYQPLHQPTNLKRVTPGRWYSRTGWILAIWTAGVVVILWFGYVMIIGSPVAITSSTVSSTALNDNQGVENLKDASENEVQKSSTTINSFSTTIAKAPLSSIIIVSSTIVASSATPSATVILIPGDHWQKNTTWTVKLPADLKSWLPAHEYGKMCASAHEVAHHVHEAQGLSGHPSYYAMDESFRDVTTNISLPQNTCNKTLTYLMESGSEGAVGPVLMGLWLAYGLAKREGRDFFIENGDWIYGKYEDYFALPTKPACSAPPPSAILSCPHQAAHLLITPSTFNYVFGHAFMEEFEDPRKQGVQRQKHIFNMIRTGYTELAHLSSPLARIVNDRIKSLSGSKETVAVQIRRGNKKPLEWKYHKTYTPLEIYLTTSLNSSLTHHLPDFPRDYIPKILLASDDMTVYQMREVNILAAQDILEAAQKNFMPKTPYWTDGEDSIWNRSPEERREMAKSYVLDLQILGEAISRPFSRAKGSNGWAVCSVGTYACRILAITMGWELAIERGHWVNIDGDFDWYGMDWA